MAETKDKRIQIRIDEETKNKIEKRAKELNRSLSNYLIYLALKDIEKNQ